jgi:hypothetical protein
MVRTGIDVAFAASADDITRAVLVFAKKRAAAMNPFLFVRLIGIKWRIRTLWIDLDCQQNCQQTVVKEYA